MTQHKLEIKINKDADGSSINLDALSITATQSLIVLLQSMTKIIELTPNSGGIKIQITKGSATIVADTSDQQLLEIERNLEEVVAHKSKNAALVNSWKSIQDIIKANGLEYEINFIKAGQRRPVIDLFKQKRRFSVPRNPRSKDYDLVFLKGKLMSVGGKNPKLKLSKSNSSEDEFFPIACLEKEALKINSFLYKNVLISAWRKKQKTKNSNPDIFFCDFYINDIYFNKFESFFVSNKNHEDVSDYFVAIHYQMKELLDAADFPGVKKFMRLFNHVSSTIGELKTILIITKSFQDHTDLLDIREEIKSLLESKLGHELT